jgi:outer membrane murein-binding lipoprotein Lpp
MNAKRMLLIILAVLCSLSLAGCTQDAASANESAAKEQDYLERIALLESTLQKEREDRFHAESELSDRLSALGQRLEQLERQEESDVNQTPEGEELIFSYRVENGKAIVTSYDGRATLVTVPATLDGYPVIAIGERAFEGKPVAAVVLPEGLQMIGWFAFYGCDKLHDVTIPASVNSIGYAVFDGCTHVTLICKEGSYAAEYADSYGLPRVSN